MARAEALAARSCPCSSGLKHWVSQAVGLFVFGGASGGGVSAGTGGQGGMDQLNPHKKTIDAPAFRMWSVTDRPRGGRQGGILLLMLAAAAAAAICVVGGAAAAATAGGGSRAAVAAVAADAIATATATATSAAAVPRTAERRRRLLLSDAARGILSLAEEGWWCVYGGCATGQVVRVPRAPRLSAPLSIRLLVSRARADSSSTYL